MDDYNNHIIANVIRYCFENAIDLMILLSYIFHVLQPFDMIIFVSFKIALIRETNAILRFNLQHLVCIKWILIFIRVRN